MLLQINSCNFFLDSQQLVQFLHKQDQANPPQWHIKPYTQFYNNISRSMEAHLYKINRRLNATAYALARQAQSSVAINLSNNVIGQLVALFE